MNVKRKERKEERKYPFFKLHVNELLSIFPSLRNFQTSPLPSPLSPFLLFQASQSPLSSINLLIKLIILTLHNLNILPPSDILPFLPPSLSLYPTPLSLSFSLLLPFTHLPFPTLSHCLIYHSPFSLVL